MWLDCIMHDRGKKGVRNGGTPVKAFPFPRYEGSFPTCWITERSPCPSEAYGGGWEGLGKEGQDCAVHVTINYFSILDLHYL